MKLSNKDKAIQYGITDNTVIDRFKTKLDNKTTGCIEFTGARWDSRDRYRTFRITSSKGNSQSVKAHRFAYALHYGFDALPKAGDPFTGQSKVINHICNNPKCVNPKHLNVLTSLENVALIGIDQEL
jgi:NADH:ubiquinone oxidoreductase subunit